MRQLGLKEAWLSFRARFCQLNPWDSVHLKGQYPASKVETARWLGGNAMPCNALPSLSRWHKTIPSRCMWGLRGLEKSLASPLLKP